MAQYYVPFRKLGENRYKTCLEYRFYFSKERWQLLFYYIKVSGIPSGNKLIKRYDILTCEDIDDFSDIKFVT